MNIRTKSFAAFVGLFVIRTLLSASTATTTMLSVIPSAPEFGQEVSLIATVTPSTATGYVSFVMDGGILVGSAAVNSSGIAESATLTLPAGSHSLVAVYGGNSSGGYAASASSALSYTVTAVTGYGFQAAVNYDVGTDSAVTAVGDFNGDGKADLAVANYNSASLSVLLGNGDGTFGTAVNYGTGTNPQSVAVGDFNGDGKADLAVTNVESANVSVLLGNGDGTFQTAVNYGTGSGPETVAVGDFNGDGKADLAVATFTTSNVSILLGNGDGTFQTAVNYRTGSDPWGLAVGDFNGDGKADLVVTNSNSDNVSVLLGNGDGTFQTAVNYGVGAVAFSVAVADFNGDGKADLVVGNFSGYNVSVLLGNGDGTFQAAVNYAAGVEPWTVAVGDFNADGKPDLAVAGNYGGVTVLLGNGNGTFQTAANYYGQDLSAYGVAVGDFNGDGRADLAASSDSSDTTGIVSILLGLAVKPSTMTLNPGTTPQSAKIGTPFPNALAVTVRDAEGNPVQNVGVQFTAPIQLCGYSICAYVHPGGTFSNSFFSLWVATNSSGVASAPFKADDIPGRFTVTAALAGLPTVDFELTNCLLLSVCVF